MKWKEKASLHKTSSSLKYFAVSSLHTRQQNTNCEREYLNRDISSGDHDEFVAYLQHFRMSETSNGPLLAALYCSTVRWFRTHQFKLLSHVHQLYSLHIRRFFLPSTLHSYHWTYQQRVDGAHLSGMHHILPAWTKIFLRRRTRRLWHQARRARTMDFKCPQLRCPNDDPSAFLLRNERRRERQETLCRAAVAFFDRHLISRLERAAPLAAIQGVILYEFHIPRRWDPLNYH